MRCFLFLIINILSQYYPFHTKTQFILENAVKVFHGVVAIVVTTLVVNGASEISASSLNGFKEIAVLTCCEGGRAVRFREVRVALGCCVEQLLGAPVTVGFDACDKRGGLQLVDPADVERFLERRLELAVARALGLVRRLQIGERCALRLRDIVRGDVREHRALCRG